MADYDDLRKLAEAAQERQQPGTLYSPRSAGDDYIVAVSPARVLALLDELEQLREALKELIAHHQTHHERDEEIMADLIRLRKQIMELQDRPE